MFKMIVVTCLMSGADCREDSLFVQSLFNCQIQGQHAAMRWLQQRPGRYLKRWTCDPRQLAKV